MTAAFTDREIALAGLLRCCEAPVPAVLADFVRGHGAEAAWRAIARATAPAAVLASLRPRLRDTDTASLRARAVDDLRRAADNGAVIIGDGDEGWPTSCFNGLDGLSPYTDCPPGAAPLALYRRGDAWPVDPGRSVAVVGSRAATPYGVRVATEIAADAAQAGCTVVSGAAFGIDAAAHRGALAATGGPGGAGGPAAPPTLAVLACGIDRSYPVAHRSLLDAVATHGAVVSEYPPGAVPARHRFLVRNRLIAAFGTATVVVEAGRRSGSLNTASTAAALVRDVLAVPGPVTSALSAGCHDLLRDHRAEMVTGWEDVSGFLGPLRPAPSPHRPGTRPTDGLDLVTGRVHEALPAHGAATADQIATESGLPMPEVLGALGQLELAGLAHRDSTGWRAAATAPRPGRARG